MTEILQYQASHEQSILSSSRQSRGDQERRGVATTSVQEAGHHGVVLDPGATGSTPACDAPDLSTVTEEERPERTKLRLTDLREVKGSGRPGARRQGRVQISSIQMCRSRMERIGDWRDTHIEGLPQSADSLVGGDAGC